MIETSDIERAIEYLTRNASAMAMARANRLYLEQYLKVRKAELQHELQGGASVAQAEVNALASEAYKETLRLFKDAIYADEYFRFLHSAAEAKIEAWRTQEASNRTIGKIG